MTRAEIINRASHVLGESPGTPGYDDPLLWSDHVTDAAQEIASWVLCYFGAVFTDIEANQSEYCLPDFIKLVGVDARDSEGNVINLVARDTQTMNAVDYAQWIDPTQQLYGPPSTIIIEGLNRCRLYPIPDYDYTAGLRFKGYCAPLWPNTDDECPFPDSVQWCVIRGAALRRIDANPTVYPEAQAARLQVQYDKDLSMLYRRKGNFGADVRYGSYGANLVLTTGGWI